MCIHSSEEVSCGSLRTSCISDLSISDVSQTRWSYKCIPPIPPCLYKRQVRECIPISVSYGVFLSMLSLEINVEIIEEKIKPTNQTSYFFKITNEVWWEMKANKLDVCLALFGRKGIVHFRFYWLVECARVYCNPEDIFFSFSTKGK